MQLVPLTVCLSIPEAVCIQTMLDAHGIPSAANALSYTQVNWLNLFAVGGIGISVVDVDREAARALLTPVDDYLPDLETDSAAFLRNAVRNTLIGFATFCYFGVLIPYWVKHRKFKQPEES